MNIEEKLRHILSTNIEQGEQLKNVSLYEELGHMDISSLSFIRILASIEETFNIEFEDEDLEVDRFKNMNDIVEYIEYKLGEKEREL